MKKNFEVRSTSKGNSEYPLNSNKTNFQRKGEAVVKQDATKGQDKGMKDLQEKFSYIEKFEIPENLKLTEASRAILEDLDVQCYIALALGQGEVEL